MKIKIYRIVYILIQFIVILALASCNNKTKDKNVYIENGKIKLGFDKSTGAFLVYTDLVNSHEFLDENAISGLPWEINLQQPANKAKIVKSIPSKFSFSKPNPLTLVLKWGNFTEVEYKNFSIRVEVTLDEKNALSFWKISLHGIKGNQVGNLVFPKIAGLKELGEEELAVPEQLGVLIKDPRTLLSTIKSGEKKITWTYPGISMQCFALYDTNKSGFYATCNDSLSYTKSFSFTLDTLNSLIYEMNNYPVFDSTLDSYTPTYDGVIGAFKGDWITAAELYREWGSKQRWCNNSRLKKGLTPPWLNNTALWVWNRGKSDNVLTPAKDLKQRLGLPVSVHWHWWHGCSYDDAFPEYFPPREGKESFINAINSAQDEGINSIVYMNAVDWGTSAKSWKTSNAAFYAIKDQNGKMFETFANKFTGTSLIWMCVATKFWKDKYSSLCDSAVNIYQTNGVYMDGACYNPSMCYDRNHGHSIGGGNYMVENFDKFTGQIRSIISKINQPVLTGESCGEAWLPYLDAFLTLSVGKERYAGAGRGEVIPFFQAVYHQYGILYGNYSSLVVPPYDELWPKEFAPKEPLKLLDKDFNKQFLMEQARSFVWGMQPTIANYYSFLASERKEEIDYLLSIGRIRYQTLKYLLYGKFIRGPLIKSPEEEINMIKLSIYIGQRNRQSDQSITTFKKFVPSIYSGTWQAEDNNIGIALASISDNPFPIDFSLNSTDYKLPSSGKIYIINNEGRKLLTSYIDKKVHVGFTLQPRSVCIVEITSDK